MEDIKEIYEMVAKTMSVREIARETGMTASTVHRRIKKGKKLGIISEDGIPFSTVSVMEQLKKMEQYDNLVVREVAKYFPADVMPEVAALIEDLDLEIVSIIPPKH